MYLQIEHPLKNPPEVEYPNWYDICPCCGERNYGDETFMKQELETIGCSNCLKIAFDDDIETCPECGFTEDSLCLYKDRGGKIVGCSKCVDCVDPEYEYLLNCLNGEI